ncbi:MAG: sigma-70 family RNA polymerase sigma factor [Prolixibacteraceae bacterium]|nr:sigma-70 family RNA polymerase sigma factor [Prolixibacteraceae bacterium]
MKINSEDLVCDWVVALKEDDAEAFNKLFGQYAKRLFYFSMGYLKSKHEAEEIVQEVFYKIWENRKSLNPELSFKAYVFKIAYHRIIEVFRKLAQEQIYRHEVILHSLDQDNNLDERTDYQSLLELLETIVSNLPPRQNNKIQCKLIL